MTLSRASMLTRHEDKRHKASRKVQDRRTAYWQVDVRDKGLCRACGRRTVAGASVGNPAKREHHHIDGRQRKDSETTGNILTLCRPCHDRRHVTRELSIKGNADGRVTFTTDHKVWRG